MNGIVVGHARGRTPGTGRRVSGITSALWQKVTRRRPWCAGQLEGVAHDPLGRRPRDEPQALDHAGHDDVLQPGVQPLGVLADDDQVDVLVGRLDARQRADGADAGVQVESLPQPDVDRAEALADRRGARPLEGDAVACGSGRALLRAAGRRAARRRRGRPAASTQSIFAPAAATTRHAACVTSGPMPSPSINTICMRALVGNYSVRMERRSKSGKRGANLRGESRVSCPGGIGRSSAVTRGIPLPVTASARIGSNG